jgi:hypothetical protein
MARADRFNATAFSQWVNGPSGRAFRLAAGAAWLLFALVARDHWWGIVAGAWGLFPLTAGLFDICWISAFLGGPLQGRTIRAGQAAIREGQTARTS